MKKTVLFLLLCISSVFASPYLLNMQTADIPDGLGGSVSFNKTEWHFNKRVMVDTTLLFNAVLLVNGGIKMGYAYSDFSFALGFRYYTFLGDEILKNFLQKKMNETAEASNTTPATINDLQLNISGFKIVPSVSYHISDTFDLHSSFVISQNKQFLIFLGEEWECIPHLILLGEMYYNLTAQSKIPQNAILYNLQDDSFGFGAGIQFKKKHWSATFGMTYPGIHIKITEDLDYHISGLPYFNATIYF